MNKNRSLFPGLTQEESDVIERISGAVENLQPSNQFVNKLETELRRELVDQKENRMKRFNLFWQSLTGAAAVVALTLLIIWLVKGMAPEIQVTPVPAINETRQPTLPVDLTPLPTATPTLPSYDRAGTTVYRAVDFPVAPSEADIFDHDVEIPATIKSVHEIAQRLGVSGHVYESLGFPYQDSYFVSDGKQFLYVGSDQYFYYYADLDQTDFSAGAEIEIASRAINSYFKNHGLDTPYTLLRGGSPGWYRVNLLTPDGLPTYLGFEQARGYDILISPDGEIIQVQARLFSKETQSVGKFSILNAQEAWQKFIDPNTTLGMIENTRSFIVENARFWNRSYPDDTPITLTGILNIYPSAEPGVAPLMCLGNYILSGNTLGLETISQSEKNTLIEAQGQFVTEADVRTFQIDVWQQSNELKQYLTGNLRRDGDKVIFSSKDVDYELSVLPGDLHVPVENVNISGFLQNGVFEWDVIGLDAPFGGGGGGGGSFARLNLTGTPIPWPTLEPVTPVKPDTTVGQRLDGVRGGLIVSIYQKVDGSQRIEYYFSGSDNFYQLTGENLEQLVAFHNHPIMVWGSVTGYNQYQHPVLTVERYEIPFPEQGFQILTGTQKLVTLAGMQVTLFTGEDGQSYVQMMSNGFPDNSLMGEKEGDIVSMEVLVIPDETFGGYPAMRVFGGGLAINPKNGQAMKFDITADEPYLIPEPEPVQLGEISSLTIESIELVYFTPDPRFADTPGAMTAQTQPAWRFYGHYSDGTIFECFIQALRQEYLLPEPENFILGG